MRIQYYVHYWVQTMFVPNLHVVQIQNEIINFLIPLIYYCDEKFPKKLPVIKKSQ